MTNKDQVQADGARPHKRDAFLAEAARQFNDRGYFDTRLEDIADKLGVAKTSISYHFKSKDALLQATYEQSCAFMAAEIALAASAPRGLERVLHVVRAHAYAHSDALAGKRPPLAVISDIGALGDAERADVAARFEACVNGLRAFVAGGVEDGSVAVRSVDASTFFVLSVLHWLPRWLSTIPLPRHEAAVDGLCDLLRFGVAADRGRAPAKAIARINDGEFPDIFDRDIRNRLKREAFLRTGARYLNRKGFRALSLNEIASDLGVTRGAFYYYIQDKDALLRACFERNCELIEKAQTLARRDAPDALGELERALRWLFEGHITEYDALVRLNLIHALPPGPKAVIAARMQRLGASFAELLANALVDGSARPLGFEAPEQIVLGSIFTASRRRLSVTPLEKTWQPAKEPLAASAAYFEPLFRGLAAGASA